VIFSLFRNMTLILMDPGFYQRATLLSKNFLAIQVFFFYESDDDYYYIDKVIIRFSHLLNALR
jgi:hypothetical protein